MKALIVFILLLAVGKVSAAPAEQVISVQHDSQRGVTCWIVNNTGISCLPDSSLPQSRAATATPSSETGRASPANSRSENAPLQATPLPQDERFHL